MASICPVHWGSGSVANGLDFEWDLKTGNPTIGNLDIWTPFCQKTHLKSGQKRLYPFLYHDKNKLFWNRSRHVRHLGEVQRGDCEQGGVEVAGRSRTIVHLGLLLWNLVETGQSILSCFTCQIRFKYNDVYFEVKKFYNEEKMVVRTFWKHNFMLA